MFCYQIARVQVARRLRCKKTKTTKQTKYNRLLRGEDAKYLIKKIIKVKYEKGAKPVSANTHAWNQSK